MAELKISDDLQKIIKKVVLDIYFPVGSIYLSATPTNPGTIFGGTWTQLKNRFLFATNDTSGAKGKDSVGGGTGVNSGSTTLTVDQIPAHNHAVNINSKWDNHGSANKEYYNIDTSWGTGWGPRDWMSSSNNTGGGKGHTHSIPYIQVYVWQRTA